MSHSLVLDRNPISRSQLIAQKVIGKRHVQTVVSHVIAAEHAAGDRGEGASSVRAVFTQ